MSRPLDGVRVIDFGQYIAGPLAAMLLAEQGAEVVHVDPPGGPRWQTPANDAWNRGKQLVDAGPPCRLGPCAGARADRVRRRAHRELPPGVMDRLGLGSETLLAEHPRLVYCSLPGFAADDPRAGLPGLGRRHRRGDRHLSTACSPRPMRAPVFTPVALASHFAAIEAAVAVVMALLARERGGRGQRIEVPLFDAMFAAIGAHGLFVDGAPGGGRPDDFWTGIFRCADRRWIQVSAATPRFRARLAAALEVPDWEADGFFDVERLTSDTNLREELSSRQVALFATRTAQEWEHLGGEIGVPIIMCRSTTEWTQTPHARTSGTVLGDAAAVHAGPPVRVWSEGEALEHVVTPTSTAQRAEHAQALEGVRVLDLTQVLAGPTTPDPRRIWRRRHQNQQPQRRRRWHPLQPPPLSHGRQPRKTLSCCWTSSCRPAAPSSVSSSSAPMSSCRTSAPSQPSASA